MADEQLRRLERAARADMNDTAALVAFARAYLRATAPPEPIVLSPDTLLKALSVDELMHVPGLAAFRRATVSGTVGILKSLEWHLIGGARTEHSRTRTLRDLVERVSHPGTDMRNVAYVKAAIMQRIVRAAGLSFRNWNASVDWEP